MSKGLVLLAERLLVAEQQAALALAKAQQDLKLYQQQQDALNQYRQVYHQQWTDLTILVEGIPAQQNAQYHAFISKLELAATQQFEGVLQIREVLSQRREEWLGAQQRRKAVALLLDKQAVRAQQQAQRQEQKMLDEFSLRSRTQHSGL